jgi:hypothetical protein
MDRGGNNNYPLNGTFSGEIEENNQKLQAKYLDDT